ncbi:MerR family transcriptional regulator [Pseudonocardia humida]|uniref:MerR family transcriptional regulator n=1 Tax=Pseudonocardia humida TaxID=2800819 RepID=A0ABT1AAK4_9PSEU|nr:MerR family transcriptional regulator [Pseudonocardia humida]MCO1659960.1 MerR family transcriptional regulator [Pseudonocardia humida]
MVQSQESLLKIGAVARRAGVSVDTVRYYERRRLLPPAQRLPSGYRLYSQAAVDTITLARRLQGLGMTLDEVADALRAHDGGGATCETERWRLDAVLDRTRARLAELTALQGSIETALARCEAGCCELSGTAAGGTNRATS